MVKRNGFTMIELLVAIAIIGVVFGVIITSSTGIQKNSRDAQRKADLASIQGALQQYYADKTFYPASLTLGSLTSLTDCSGDPNCSTPSKTYLTSIPKDPTSSTSYKYAHYKSRGLEVCENAPTKCQFYKLCTALETGAAASVCGGLANYNFEVTPP